MQHKPLWLLMCLLLLNVQWLQAQQPVFRIGVIDVEDGQLAQGARLAVDEINRAGGVIGADGTAFALELVLQAPDNIRTAVTNINQASVIAVLGPEKSGDVLANMSQLQSLQVPILTPAVDDTILALDTSERIFRIRAQELLLGSALAEYLANVVKSRSIVTVQLDLESTAGIVGFTTALAEYGIPPSQAFLFESGRKIEEFAQSVLNAAPEVIATYGAPEVASSLYVALRTLGWEGVFVYNRAHEAAFRDAVPAQQFVGIIGASTWTVAARDDRSEAFTLKFVRALGSAPSAIHAAAYDAIYLLANAIGKPGDLLSNLTTASSTSGIQGTLTPATLPRGETGENVFITQTGILGGEELLARYVGKTRLTEDEPVIIVVPTSTPTPMPTATPDGVVITITRAVQNVRSGPGTNYDVIGQLKQGEQAKVIGANLDFTWLVVNFRGVNGWLSRDILDVFGALNTLPIIAPPPTPTPLPATATPTGLPFADVTVISALPTRITLGTPFNVTVTVFNQGSVAAGTFAVASSFLPGGVYAGINLPGLAAGQQTNVSLTGTITGATGPQTVVIVTDLNNQVDEGPNGKANNNFNYTYIADAPILSVNGTGSLTVANTATAALDNGTPDIQWNSGIISPLGGAKLAILSGFTNLDQVHKDAVAASSLSTAPIGTVPIGTFIAYQTDGGSNYGVFQVVQATSGGNLVFNYRTYQ